MNTHLSNPERRNFLNSLASLAGLLMLPRLGFAEVISIRPKTNPFTLGVASGSPSSDGFVLWTRLYGSEIPENRAVKVDWEVTDPAQSSKVFAKGSSVALPELGHSVHVEVSGLPADRWYDYQFRVGDKLSTKGRARSLPNVDTLPPKLRFAYASCQHWETGFYAAYRHMQEENLDLVVFVGDYIYEGASKKGDDTVRRHGLPTIKTLEDYRLRYAVYKQDTFLQAMHARCPWLVTWDDHEVQNNYAASLSMYGTRDFLKQRAAGYQAFYENMPLRASTMLEGINGLLKGAELRIYDRVLFGKLAAFHILDCRQYRDAPLCPEESKWSEALVCVPPNESRSMLGVAQERWLDDSFAKSVKQDIRWNLIAEQSRFTPANYRHGPGRKMSTDNWDGYPEARLRLIKSIIRHRPKNSILIGGDIHHNWVARVHENPYEVKSPVIASEFVGTSITSTHNGTQADAERQASKNPHCLLSNYEKRGYGVVELTSDYARVDLRVLDDVRNEKSGITTLASFVVDNGKAVRFSGIER